MPDDALDLPYESWSEQDWKKLLLAIDQKRCTPFLGAGASRPTLPSGAELAEYIAAEIDYPFADRGNLARVAQFGAISEGSLHVKGLIKRKLDQCGEPDFDAPDSTHAIVASLDLPVYLTTNYDDFLSQAIERRQHHSVQRRICRWNRAELDEAGQDPVLVPPSSERPLVFHLHGHLSELDSLVVTEDDYLDFLVRLSENEARAEQPDEMLIPPRVREAFRNSTLLFLGYSLEDMNFRVLFRSFANYLHRAEGPRHVAVQLRKPAPRDATERRELEASIRYLQESFKQQKVRPFWGSCADFARELRRRRETPHVPVGA
ncbi:MAG: SIR2 family protein [Planctomycetes bacterium]|nr:SIR2 family protein [Planctomycetota bacterium]